MEGVRLSSAKRTRASLAAPDWRDEELATERWDVPVAAQNVARELTSSTGSAGVVGSASACGQWVFVQHSSGMVVWQPQACLAEHPSSHRVCWLLDLPRTAAGAAGEARPFSSASIAFPSNTEDPTESVVVAVQPSGRVLTWYLAAAVVAHPPGEAVWAARFVSCTVGRDSKRVPLLADECVTGAVHIGYDEATRVRIPGWASVCRILTVFPGESGQPPVSRRDS